jgi:hypothetical protein
MEDNETNTSMSLPTRLLKVFLSPGEVFESIKKEPSWFGALAVGGVLVSLSILLVPAEIWVQTMREQAAQQGREMPAFMASAGPAFRLASVVSAAIFWFIWAFIMAGVVTLVFSFLFGDEGRYSQYLSVVSHSLFIGAVGAVLLVPLKIVQGDPGLTLNVGTFLPFLREGYAFRVLKLLDLFGLWGYAVMALGVTKIDPRRGMGLALSFFWGFAVVFALAFGVFGG